MGVEGAVELEVRNARSRDRPHAHAHPPTASPVSVPSPMHTPFLREDGDLQVISRALRAVASNRSSATAHHYLQTSTWEERLLSRELIDGRQHAKCIASQ